MSLEQLFEEQISDTTTFDEHRVVRTADDKLNLSVGFECNICLDVVRDPVVTFCGHLYCWPCIYKWIHFQTKSSENSDQQSPQCPVCKAEVSLKTLIPLYGRGQAVKTSEGKVPDRGILIPQRAPSPRCGGHTPITTTHSNSSYRNYSRQPAYMSEPILSSGGVVYLRMFGNSLNTLYEYPSSYTLAGSSNPRLRRQLLLADRSLSRICFFLFCCAVTCLLLF